MVSFIRESRHIASRFPKCYVASVTARSAFGGTQGEYADYNDPIDSENYEVKEKTVLLKLVLNIDDPHEHSSHHDPLRARIFIPLAFARGI